jgi:hypothetical protein
LFRRISERLLSGELSDALERPFVAGSCQWRYPKAGIRWTPAFHMNERLW